MHEVAAIERGEMTLKKKPNYAFECLGTLPTEVVEFRTLRHAILQVAQKLYLNERHGAMLGQYLHITQLRHHAKVNREMGLSKGYQITI